MNRKNADRSKQKKKRTAKDIVLDILLVVFFTYSSLERCVSWKVLLYCEECAE